MQELETEFTVLYFETRGIGGTSRPSPDKMSTKDMASDLEQLRNHLSLDQLVVVGHSNGGSIALTYAEDFPNRVKKLVLVDHELAGFKSDNFQIYATKRKDDLVYGPALQAMMKVFRQPPSTDEEFAEGLKKIIPYYFTDTTKTNLLADALEGGQLSAWNFVNQQKCDAALGFSAVEGLANIQAHTLAINGEDDAMCSVAAARKAIEGIGSRAELKLIQNCGHCPWLERPEEFFPAVKQFLRD